MPSPTSPNLDNPGPREVSDPHDTSAAAAGSSFIRRSPKESRLDFVRRREIMLAGWENDHEARERLGSSEQATWWAGRCAADPALIHPYGPTRNGKSLGYGSWSDDILAMRAAFADTPPPPVAGTDARETTRELSEAELDAIDARAKAATPGPYGVRYSRNNSGDVGISAPNVLNIIAECFADMRHAGEYAATEAYNNAHHFAGLDPQTVRALVAQARRAKP